MKKRTQSIFILGTLILTAVSLCVMGGCKKKTEESSEIKLSENAYIAETSSGDVIINLDEEGNPIEMIDANGEVIDLKSEDVKVEKDKKTGEIKSVIIADKTIAVKEKADEQNSERIIANAKEQQEKKVSKEEVKEEKKEEKKEEVVVPTGEEKSSEKKKEKFTPGVDAPELPSDKPKTSEKPSEPASEEKKAEEPAVNYTEEAVSGTMYGAFYGTKNSQLIYSKAGTEYAAAKDPKTGSDAYLTGSNAVELVGKTSNGWYHVKAYTAYGPAFTDRVNGYVPQSALIDEATKNKLVEEKNKQVEEERKKQEEEEKKKEKEKSSEQPSENPSEKPSENPSEKPSEQPSEQPSVPPSSEEMKKIEEEQKKRAEEQEKQQYSVSASANRGIFDQINAWRTENGLEELSWGSENEGICSTRATEQTDYCFNQHGSIDHGYGTTWSGAENLSDRGTGAVFEGWKASGGHNQTMLGEYSYCVVYTGYADGMDGVTVALFW